jgi:endonuclease/exonuclease/phosphatase family metal-dependent hydrolase
MKINDSFEYPNYEKNNSERSYPNFDVSDMVTEYKKIFILNNIKFSKYNKLPIHTGLRIATFNVHYFTNVNIKESINGIVDDIKEVDPDIIALQEMIFGDIERKQEDIQTLLTDYKLISFCNVVPSWFGGPYGNGIMIKNTLLKYFMTNTFFNKNNLCDKSRKSCFLKQKNAIFNSTFDKVEETRCFIKLDLLKFNIYVVHLSVESAELRKLQLIEINDVIDKSQKNSIILGDFNIVDVNSLSNKEAEKFLSSYSEIKENRYNEILTDELQFIKNDLKWIDSFDEFNNNNIKKIVPLNYTSWTSTRVDYIFFKIIKEENDFWKITNTGMYFTNNSDHLIVHADLNIIDTSNLNIQNIPLIIKNNEELNIKEINHEFFNGQPISALNWFKINNNEPYVNSLYTFQDPYLAGNSFSVLKLHGNGVYLTSDINTAIYFSNTFTTTAVQNNKLDKFFENTVCIFEFNIPQDENIKIVDIPANQTYLKYDTDLDDKYDLIIIKDEGEAKMSLLNYDNEKRNHKFLNLIKIYIGINIGKTKEKDIKKLYTDNYDEFSKLINYVNEKYKNDKFIIGKNPVIDINQIDVNKFKLNISDLNDAYLLYPVFEKDNDFYGGDYYKKYMKYKLKYHNLKNKNKN